MVNLAPCPNSATQKLYLQCGFPSHNPKHLPLFNLGLEDRLLQRKWQENEGPACPQHNVDHSQ